MRRALQANRPDTTLPPRGPDSSKRDPSKVVMCGLLERRHLANGNSTSDDYAMEAFG